MGMVCVAHIHTVAVIELMVDADVVAIVVVDNASFVRAVGKVGRGRCRRIVKRDVGSGIRRRGHLTRDKRRAKALFANRPERSSWHTPGLAKSSWLIPAPVQSGSGPLICWYWLVLV